MTGIADTQKELSLQEMLADPIVQAVMACDGVTRLEVEELIETARDKRAGGDEGGREAGRMNPVPSVRKNFHWSTRNPGLNEEV